MSLPRTLRTRILRTYHADLDPGIVRKNSVDDSPSSSIAERDLWLDIVSRKAISEAESVQGEVPDWRKVVSTGTFFLFTLSVQDKLTPLQK
jgi:hypothetical protein